MFVKVDSTNFVYRFLLKSRWVNFFILVVLFFIVRFYSEFSIEVIFLSFLSSFFAVLSAFKVKFKGYECSNVSALLFIFFAFMIGAYSSEFSRIVMHLNISIGIFIAIVAVTFIFKFFYKN